MLKNLAVALVEPTYEVNLGHTARIVKNFGISRLILIDPRVDIERARRFASHAQDILESLEESRFEDIVKDFDLVVGTTAVAPKRHANVARNAISPEELSQDLANFRGRVCILFGRDTTGLRRREISLCDIIVRISTGTEYPTLNISHAAAIILYELSKTRRREKDEVASRRDRDRAVRYAMKLAEVSNYPVHKRRLLEEALKQIIGRSRAKPREVSLIIGLFRRALLALERQMKHS